MAFVDRTMIGGALPLIRLDIAMTDAQAGGVIGTAFAVPYGVTALILAAVLRGRQASMGLLVGGVVLWTAASLATGAVHSLGELTLARAALGIGQAMFVPVAIACLVDGTGPDDRARALALFTSGSTIGRSVALLTIGTLLSVLGMIAHDGNGALMSGIAHWRWLYVITALPNVAMLGVLASVGVGKMGRSSTADADTPGASVASPATRVDWPTLALFFVVAIMPVMLIQALSGWLPSVIVRSRGLLPAQAAMLLGAVTLFAAPAGQLVGGWLMTRQKAWHGHIPVIVLVALTLSLLPLAALVWAPGLTGSIVSVAVVSVTLGIASFCGLFGVQMLAQQSDRITVNGVFLALVTLVGVGAGPLLTGVLATSGTSLDNALFATGAIACGICAVAVTAVRRRYRQHLR